MVTKKAAGMDMDDVHVQGKGDTRKPEDMVDLYSLPDKKYVKLRPFGSVHPYQGHWIETKKKDGGKGSFYYPCAAFDIETGQSDSTKHCPWCDDQSGHVRTVTDYFFNAIHRREQQNKPVKTRMTAGETESGFKEKSSESWTPVKAVRVTGNTLKKLQALKQLNTVENADGDSVNYGVSHPKYGADVSIKKDKDLPPASMYDVQYGSQTSLSKEERSYLVWDLTALMITPTQAEAEGEYVKWAKRMGLIEDKPSGKGSKGKKAVPDDDEDDDEEEDEAPAKSSKKPAAKKKPVAKDDDDDFDEDEEEDEPAPKKKPVAKKKAAAVDDDDDDFDEDDEDEPAPKKKAAAASKKRAAVDDDEDDEEEDEPPAKSKAKAKPAAKKKVVDEDDEDDEEEDEPAPKSKAKAKPAAKKKVVEEDDDDEDDEEEDEPPAKSKAKPAAKKKKVVDDDDDDFDE